MSGKTLAEIATGPDRMIYVVGVIFVMAIFGNILSASFANVFGVITIVDVIIIIVLSNTVCRKKIE